MNLEKLGEFWHHIMNSETILSDQIRDEKTSDALAQPGYVGSRYNGTLFIGMNPGAGGNKETEENKIIYNALENLKNSTNHKQAFDQLNLALLNAIPSWKIHRNLVICILSALALNLEDVAWLNIIPWRSASKTDIRKFYAQSWREYTETQINLLKPHQIIALGKGTGEELCKLYKGSAKVTVIPRTRGDVSLHKDAKSIIDGLRTA